ncbi:MAG: hypothetical protein AB7E29_12580 [Xanthobacter sp.]
MSDLGISPDILSGRLRQEAQRLSSAASQGGEAGLSAGFEVQVQVVSTSSVASEGGDVIRRRRSSAHALQEMLKNLPGTSPIREWNRRRRARRRLRREMFLPVVSPPAAVEEGATQSATISTPMSASPAALAQAALPLLLHACGPNGTGQGAVIVIEGLPADGLRGVWANVLGEAGLAARDVLAARPCPVPMDFGLTVLRTLQPGRQGAIVLADLDDGLTLDAMAPLMEQAREGLAPGGLLILAGAASHAAPVMMERAEHLLSHMARHGFHHTGLLWLQNEPRFFVLFARKA